jgi:putative ABC transport system ATP-binding protein
MPWDRNSWPHRISSQREASRKRQNMPATTVISPSQFIGDQDATEATLRRSAALASQANALETRHLSRSVAERVLVSDITVQVQPGEVLAVVGPSGAGKSSFLRLLNRLDEPTGGTVCLNGQDYRELAPRDVRRRVGMVMQVAYLFPGTVAANIAFGPRQRGESLASEQIAALLERVGLPGYQARDVINLSGGEAQRVSLARTLANAPEALLLDEPTSALDDVSARGIEELVLSIIRERRMACVIVTHNTAQARRIADRTMIVEAGKLITIGRTKEVLRDS